MTGATVTGEMWQMLIITDVKETVDTSVDVAVVNDIYDYRCTKDSFKKWKSEVKMTVDTSS